ncbi:MAG: DUF934 domain-containing protein [Pseudomonadales bacterium]
MALLNRDGEVVEPTSISNGEAAAGGLALTPLENWAEESGDGLLLEPTDEPEPRFLSAPLIAINFPAFNDGRGLSLAVLLRTRYDYPGELRAVGDVHPDLIHYMKRCGFDTFQMPEGRSLPPARHDGASTLAPYSDYYQASVLQPEPAYRRVRRGA